LPHHRSAKKRMRQDEKRRARNRAVKSQVKTAIKKVLEVVGKEEAPELLRQAESVIDRAAKKGVIHWRAAARKKSRLGRKVRASTG